MLTRYRHILGWLLALAITLALAGVGARTTDSRRAGPAAYERGQ